jgi:RNase P subunit RPR2
MIRQTETICPRCSQGYVITARVRANGAVVFICEECEAIWFCKDRIEYATFNFFNFYMERLGLPVDWRELEIVDNSRSDQKGQ